MLSCTKQSKQHSRRQHSAYRIQRRFCFVWKQMAGRSERFYSLYKRVLMEIM